MEQYLAVIFAVGLGSVILIMLLLLYRYLPPTPIKESEKTAYDHDKESTYECGVEPTGTAHRRFSVRFYLVAMLFVVFDIEGVLIYPWAVTFKRLGIFGFFEMIVFLGVLTVGLAYVWKKGALEW